MHVIQARNVNDAYFKGMTFLSEYGEKQTSRAGDVLVAPMPVTTVYEFPKERVLFDLVRDANPFFHLMESLWMLAGRNDATWLDQFVKDFSSRYAEGGTMHGAYGHRWRTHFEPEKEWEPIDQLQVVIDRLKADPLDRRVVIQMWDPEYDLGADHKDIPCNLCVMLRILYGALEITVPCRSNDAIWGAYGANAVHFSVLQEYLAAKIGVMVGPYYQVSNNFHAYINVFENKFNGLRAMSHQPYDHGIEITPIITTPEKFDDDLRLFFKGDQPTSAPEYVNPFFYCVAAPMFYSYRNWRNGDKKLARALLKPFSPAYDRSDWLIAAKEWYARRA